MNENIVAKEVEKVLMECPGVERAAVLNLKDALGKFQLTAVITKKHGMDISANDIHTFCASKLKERQRPKNIAFMQEMPLDSHGMINKYKLRFEFGSN